MTWLMLVTEVPSAPAYLRVKLRRRVQRLGAMGLKGAVYVLPESGEAMAAFRGLRQDIVTDGGNATVCRAELIDGMTDSDLMALFNQERGLEYQELILACADLGQRWPAGTASADPVQLIAERARLFGRFEEILGRDFFGHTRSEEAMQSVERLAALRSGPAAHLHRDHRGPPVQSDNS